MHRLLTMCKAPECARMLASGQAACFTSTVLDDLALPGTAYAALFKTSHCVPATQCCLTAYCHKAYEPNYVLLMPSKTIRLDLLGLQTTQSLGIRVFEFQEFARVGSSNPSPPVPPKPQDLCTIMYTSGTTDTPKVLLSHQL